MTIVLENQQKYFDHTCMRIIFLLLYIFKIFLFLEFLPFFFFHKIPLITKTLEEMQNKNCSKILLQIIHIPDLLKMLIGESTSCSFLGRLEIG